MNVPSTIKALPARVLPLPGESLVSLIGRTAATMGYDGPYQLLALLADSGQVPANVNPLSPGPVLDHLAALLRLTPERLLGLTVHRLAPHLGLRSPELPSATLCDSKTALKYFLRGTFPICPRCLQQDDSPYERLVWSLRALPICLEHRCLLIGRCPRCQRALRPERPAVSSCRCGQLLADMEPCPVSDEAVRLVATLEDLCVRGVSCLPELSAAALCWWAERLATAAVKTPAWLNRTQQQLKLGVKIPAELIGWLAAGEMIRRWPDRLYEFLDVFQHTPKHRQTSTGIALRFGLLLREAARLEDLGFPTPAQAFRQYLLEHYSGGHLSGKVCLFQKPRDQELLRNRPWITQTEAATLLQVRQAAISPLVDRGLLTGQVHVAGDNGRSVGLVQRDSVETLRRDLQSAVGVSAAAGRLGLGIRAVRALIHDDLLSRAIRTQQGWRIPVSSLSALDELCHSAKPIKELGPQWMSLRQATRIHGRAGLTLSQLLALIQTGKVTARLADPAQALYGLVIAKRQLEAVLPDVRRRQEERRGCSVHRLGKTLFPERPVKVDVIKKWIDAGLLNARQQGRTRIISPAEIRRFRQTYCLRAQALSILGVSGTTLKRWQDAGRIRPVYPKRLIPHAGLYLYRRADVERLLITPRRRTTT